MKTIIFGGGAALCAGTLAATGAFDDGEVYARPVDQVYAAIAYMPMPPEFKEEFNRIPGSDIRVDRVPNQSVTWRFTHHGHELGAFTAALGAEDPTRTRVSVSFEPGQALPGQALQFALQPFVQEVAEIAMAEQVDAVLEQRKFDARKVQAAVLAYAATHPDVAKRFFSDVESRMNRPASAESFDEDEDDVRLGGAGPMNRPVPTEPKPMTDLSRFDD